MPAGRPTKYKPEYITQLLDYFNIDSGYDTEVENSKGIMQSVRHAADLPTLAGFACKIKVHRDTIHQWATQYPEFSDAIKEAKEHQERILVENGLKAGYHPSFAIFTAKNVLNWKDKQESTVTSEVKLTDLTQEELDAKIKQLEMLREKNLDD